MMLAVIHPGKTAAEIMQRAFAVHTKSMPEPLHVRVGLNAGEPIEEDGDLFGATVILASRIAAKAGAGEILVPDTVRGLLSGKGFMFSDRGEFVPKALVEKFDDARVALHDDLRLPLIAPDRGTPTHDRAQARACLY